MLRTESQSDIFSYTIDSREVMKTEMENIWQLRIKRLRAKVVRMRKIKRIWKNLKT